MRRRKNGKTRRRNLSNQLAESARKASRPGRIAVGAAALPFMLPAAAQAAPFIETADFGNDFANISLAPDGTTQLSGAAGGADATDVVRLAGLPFGAEFILAFSGEAGDPGGGSVEPGEGSVDPGEGSQPGDPTGFFLNFLDDSGQYLDFAGDSFGSVTTPGPGSGSVEPGEGSETPNPDPFAYRGFDFLVTGTVTGAGNVNLRIGGPDALAGTYTATLMSVPEPGTLAFLGTGLAGLGFIRSRSRSAQG